MEGLYGIIKAKRPETPPTDLLRVPHQNRALTVAHPAFGPNQFISNITKMQEQYSHPQTGKAISFRIPLTLESISVANYNFKSMAKPEIFDRGWLQLGYLRKTSKGVFINPPTDETGEVITSMSLLNSFLKNGNPVNGIYLFDNGFAYAPYETFEQGVQDGETFARGGLARALEHTTEQIAKNLQAIASMKNYPHGVDVYGFDAESSLRVAGLGSYGDLGYGQLIVYGLKQKSLGYTFGVLDSAE